MKDSFIKCIVCNYKLYIEANEIYKKCPKCGNWCNR